MVCSLGIPSFGPDLPAQSADRNKKTVRESTNPANRLAVKPLKTGSSRPQVSENMVRPDRLERPTFWFVARRSIQLSYGRTFVIAGFALFRASPAQS